MLYTVLICLSQAPSNVSHSPIHAEVIKDVFDNPDIQRLAGYASGALFHPLIIMPDTHVFFIAGFATFCPKGFDRAQRIMDDLHAHDSTLRRPFLNSVYPTSSINFGPRTVCVIHGDHLNDPLVWCPVTGMGNYDYKKGGHIVLPDLRLVIEFPPGSTVLIPSCVFRHGNCRLASTDEVRMSFTQYFPGGLSRYHAYGFRTQETLVREDAPLWKSIVEGHSARYHAGLKLYSTRLSLERDLRRLFPVSR